MNVACPKLSPFSTPHICPLRIICMTSYPCTVRQAESLDEEPRGKPGIHVGANIDLERAFERISETSRAVVWLHDVEGYTHEEIAEQMGKTVSFSKSQLARAHARLRSMLDEGAHA